MLLALQSAIVPNGPSFVPDQPALEFRATISEFRAIDAASDRTSSAVLPAFALPVELNLAGLVALGSRLGMSTSQIEATNHRHALYSQQFSLLRNSVDQELELGFKQALELAAVPPPDLCDRVISQRSRMMESLRMVEIAFWNDLSSIFAPSQSFCFELLRLKREREFYRFPCHCPVQEAGIELVDLLLEIEIEPDVWREICDDLVAYENRMMLLEKRRHAAGQRWLLQVAKSLRDIGVNDVMAFSPSACGEIFLHMGEIQENAAKGVGQLTVTAAQVNRGYLATLKVQLRCDKSRQLGRVYDNIAFPEIKCAQVWDHTLFVATLEDGTLPGALRHNINTIAESYLLRADEIRAQARKKVIAIRSTHSPAMHRATPTNIEMEFSLAIAEYCRALNDAKAAAMAEIEQQLKPKGPSQVSN